MESSRKVVELDDVLSRRENPCPQVVLLGVSSIKVVVLEVGTAVLLEGLPAPSKSLAL